MQYKGESMSYNIVDSNDIFLFFEVIDRAKPNSVIDIGMFIMRIGAVSRNVKDISVPDKVRLDGLSFEKLPDFPIYKTVYDNIYKNIPEDEYDLGIMLDVLSVCLESELQSVIEFVDKKVSFLLIDDSSYKKIKSYLHVKSETKLSSEENQYILVSI